MQAVSTNQIPDILHFNANEEYFYNFEKDRLWITSLLAYV